LQPIETSIFISCALILSAFTFSFAGFKFGLVALPLLALVLPIKDAVAIQLPFSVLLVVINSFRYGKSIKWNELKPFFIGSAAAISPAFQRSICLNKIQPCHVRNRPCRLGNSQDSMSHKIPEAPMGLLNRSENLSWLEKALHADQFSAALQIHPRAWPR
jgi:hypothetical protein